MNTGIPYFRAEKIADQTWMITNAFVEKTSAISYLVEGRDYALLIDTIMGWGNLKKFCESLTSKPIKLANTHFHIDHCGGNFHFQSCYMPHRDIGLFQESIHRTKEEIFQEAKEAALPEYKDLIECDDNFRSEQPMLVYPIYDGDVFDLGDREIEVVEVGGHSPGCSVFIDHKSRICFSGDACNGFTMLCFANAFPIEQYMHSLLHLKKHQSEIDMMYGGHQIFDPHIIDEGIETVARVLAGTDDHYEVMGNFGREVVYAGKVRQGSFTREDGVKFNLCYWGEKITGAFDSRQRIVNKPLPFL